MTATATIFARVASFVPLIILALGLAFVAIIAVVWPSEARQAMVDRLGAAIKDLVLAASGLTGASVHPAASRNPGDTGADSSE
jgi:hypothetical protein